MKWDRSNEFNSTCNWNWVVNIFYNFMYNVFWYCISKVFKWHTSSLSSSSPPCPSFWMQPSVQGQGHLLARFSCHMSLYAVICNLVAPPLSGLSDEWMNSMDGSLYHKTIHWNECVWECWGVDLVKWVKSHLTIVTLLWDSNCCGADMDGKVGAKTTKWNTQTLWANYGHEQHPHRAAMELKVKRLTIYFRGSGL